MTHTAMLAELVRRWGFAYILSASGAGLYSAERRDNGACVHLADPEQLEKEIAADYQVCPVKLHPRGTTS